MAVIFCLLIANNLPPPEGWTAGFTTSVLGVEPGPTWLVVQQSRWARGLTLFSHVDKKAFSVPKRPHGFVILLTHLFWFNFTLTICVHFKWLTSCVCFVKQKFQMKPQPDNLLAHVGAALYATKHQLCGQCAVERKFCDFTTLVSASLAANSVVATSGMLQTDWLNCLLLR